MKKAICCVLLLAGAALALVFAADKKAPKPKKAAKGKEVATEKIVKNPYYDGSGGKEMSIAVLVPEGKGLGKDEAYLPTLVQGVFVADFSKYSAMSILDRQNLEKVLKETESGIYESQSDFLELGKITKTGYALTGSVTKTQTAYTFSIAVTDTKSGQTKAAYNGSCTIAEFDNFSGIRKASGELLTQMGVQLTDAAKAELSGAAAAQSVKAQTALAQGITAQKRGTEVESLVYYNMAAAFDPSLLEAQKRVSVTAASVSSGNIGEDARNDIKWRNDWVARLKEFETFLDNYIKDNPPQYEFLYSTALEYGKVDYQKETMPITLNARLIFADFGYFEALDKTIETVRQGLLATGRAEAWGLAGRSRYTEEYEDWFGNRRRTGDMIPSGWAYQRNFRNGFTITVDILNDQGKVIGSAQGTARAYYAFNPNFTRMMGVGWVYSSNKETNQRIGYHTWVVIDNSDFRSYVSGSETRSEYTYEVNVNDITDTLTVRVTSVNGRVPASVKNLAITEYKGSVSGSNIFFDGTGKIMGKSRIEDQTSGYITVSGSIWGKPISAIGLMTADYDKITDPYSLSLSMNAFWNKNGKKPGKYWWTKKGSGYKWSYEQEVGGANTFHLR